MSLANIIVQQPRAYLMSDSGYFRRDGAIAQLSPKVLMFPGLGMALTCRGQHDMLAGILRELQVFEAHREATTIHDVIENFWLLYRTACMCQGVPPRGREHACDMQVIWWDPAAQRARGALISNIVDDHAGLEPNQLTVVTCSLTGADPNAPLGVELDICDPAAFDVRRDGVALVERQRATPWSIPGMPEAHYVAGEIHLTTVDQDGLRCEVLHSWPDRVGERIRVG